MKAESLCQNCLRPCPAEPGNAGTCPACGGDTCFCEGCLGTLALLRAGCRSPSALGLKAPIAGWSEEGGVTPGAKP